MAGIQHLAGEQQALKGEGGIRHADGLQGSQISQSKCQYVSRTPTAALQRPHQQPQQHSTAPRSCLNEQQDAERPTEHSKYKSQQIIYPEALKQTRFFLNSHICFDSSAK